MINSSTGEKFHNVLCGLLVVLGVFALSAYFFDFYYDLNDDMVIKDILSGAYSGLPNGRTNQILYPLGFIMSLLYQLFSALPVWGLFLCGCFALCFWMVVYRMEGYFQKGKVKIGTVVLMVAVFLSLLLWELVYVQYSVVCGLLVGTACFWFYTTPVECTIGEFWKKNIPALLLCWIAFLIRSEMFLLMTPFIAVVGILHWAEAVNEQEESYTGIGSKSKWKHVIAIDNFAKYVAFVATLVLGLGVILGADYLAYREAGWQEYRNFFDARTNLYDFTWYPSYEENKEFYDENAISEIQYKLIDNYNFGLDESITANTLEVVASYGERPKMFGNSTERMTAAFAEMIKRMVLPKESPYNYYVLTGYGLVIGLAVLQKDKKYIWRLVILGVLRCIPWMYLLYVQRALPRITHPLYIAEFLILFAILVRELYDRPLWNPEKYYRIGVAGVFALIAMVSLPFTWGKVATEQLRREEILVNQSLLDQYAKANPENYYYLDVYSTVNFVEKIFEDVDNSRKNYDLMGGWYCHSPLQKANMLTFTGVETIEEALLQEQVYFVAESIADVSFVEEYYKTKDMKVSLDVIDTVGEGENSFVVYRIEKDTKPVKTFKKK